MAKNIFNPVQLKQLAILKGMASDIPDFLPNNHYARDLINFEPISDLSGIRTVNGYQRYAGGDLATDQSFVTISFNNITGSISKYDTITGSSGQTAIVLLESQSSTANGTYFPIFYTSTSTFNVGDSVYKGGSIIGTIIEISSSNTYYNNSTYRTIDAYQSLWYYYANNYISAVPGSGSIVGVFKLKNIVYALRNNTSGEELHLYKANNNTWEQIDFFALEPGGHLRFVIYNFGDGEKLYGITGNCYPFIFDGNTLTVVDTKLDSNEKPELIEVFNNQLILYYSNLNDSGSIIYSAVNDPTDFESTSLGAGEIKVSFPVSEMTTLVENNLGLFGKNISIVSVDSSGSFILTEFAKNTYVVRGTLSKLSDVVYATQNYIQTLSTTNKYGDFELNNVVKNNSTVIQENLQKSDYKFCYVTGNKNQYRLIIGQTILVITVAGDNTYLFSKQVVPHKLTCVSNILTDEDGDDFYYGDENGYVYKADVGYTFDIEDIYSILITPIISITNNPQIKCRLRKLVIPGSFGTSEVILNVNYNDIDWRRWGSETIYTEEFKTITEGYYDESNFNEVFWGSSTPTQNKTLIETYLTGTSPSLTFFLLFKNLGLEETKLNIAYLHYTPRGRLR